MSRRRKKKDSPVKTVFLILIAAVVMTAAVYVVMSVAGKISSDYKGLDFSKEEETTHITIDTSEEPRVGWNETDRGWMYYLDGKNYVTSQWKDIDGYLYYFDESGIMAIGEFEKEGQIYTCHETKGYLKDIQTDLDYVPENKGEDLDSLVRTNAFWCYLKSEDETGLFRTILYRKTVENKVMVLGGEDAPEKTTKNSMRAYGDYVYYLPKVGENRRESLSETERGMCDKLFRMRPGGDTKELIAENVDGYMVLGDTIYYAQAGTIAHATSGVVMATGEGGYDVIIKDDSCYLVDELGNPAMAKEGGSVSIGDRVYRMEEDGRINSVKHGQIAVNGRTYYLGGSGTKSSVCAKSNGTDTALIREKYGVQSYCIVDNQIYYSSYVDKESDGEWHSQIFKADLEGKNREPLSERFPGVMRNMYYYEDEAQIYGEYHPAIWRQAYGRAAVITRDGAVYGLEDSEARTGKHVDGNDMLEIIMVRDGKVICLWHDCEWSKEAGITDVLWSKAIELKAGDRSLINAWAAAGGEEAGGSEETEEEAVIQPIEGAAPQISPETAAPGYPSVNHDPVISTEKPDAGTSNPTVAPIVPPVAPTEAATVPPTAAATVSPTAAPPAAPGVSSATEHSTEVKIVPLN